jgi:hypothetical protein
MTKHRFLRTPLAAVIGLLAFLAVPAAAQAHHVESTAKCELVANQPTVTLNVTFVGFSSTHKVTGTITFDSAFVKDVVPTDVSWAPNNNGTLVYTRTTSPGAHSVQGDFTWPGKDSGDNGEAHHTVSCPEPSKPAILLDKTGAATAAAGSTFTYSFKATNVGNVTLTNVVLTDDRCQSTLTRVEPNLADQAFDKGDEWFYTCTVVAPAGPAQVDNVAKVCGDFDADDVDPMTVCDDDPHTFTVPPPGTPPGDNPPGENPPGANPPSSTPNVVPPPGGGVLPVSIVSGRASLRGPSGCVKQAFKARVSGRSIASVTFYVDGRKVKTISGKRAAYVLQVRPGRYGFGRHKIVARVQFTAASGTKARRIPLTFRRCAQGAVAPRFTG